VPIELRPRRNLVPEIGALRAAKKFWKMNQPLWDSVRLFRQSS
jgi:hypothetical protein